MNPTDDLTTALARTLVDEWARHGVALAAVSPGSRSTPLALALVAHGSIRTEIFHDERSASFFALGAGKASGVPAVVLCTSGTAAANLHPAVVEARWAGVPLLVCTADRPPELRDTGAGQTIDQVKLYGDDVRWYVEMGADPATAASWRPVASRAFAEALGGPGGPVHVNLAFREPLVPTGAPVPVPEGRPEGAPWTRVTAGPAPAGGAAVVAAALAGAGRPLLVAGWGLDRRAGAAVAAAAERLQVPLVADPLSGARHGRAAIRSVEALLRDEAFAATHAPDVVVRAGAAPASRVAAAWLAAAPRQVVVEAHPRWLDPHRTAAELVVGHPGDVFDALPTGPASSWLSGWLDADARASAAIDAVLDASATPTEPRVARDVLAAVPAGGTLVVASSMPVRDLDWFGRPRPDVVVVANRGANGIDGFVSTALGVAASSGRPTVALCGDLSLLHDSNGLLGAAGRDLDLTLVVVDNDGGGIFSFLPQSDDPAHFERLFGTPHGVDLAALARVHRVPAERVERAAGVAPAVAAAVAAGGVRMVVVPSDRAANVAHHRDAWAAAADALR